MKKAPSFTIIEVLIALSISSVIIFGMMQTYNNVMRYLSAIQGIQETSRKICLLFNQMERDFSTAFIPSLLPIEEVGKNKTQEDEKDGKEDKDKRDDKNNEADTDNAKQKEINKEKSPEENEKEEEKKIEKLKIYFIAEINDNGFPKKIGEQRCYPFKNVSFINTNPFQVYGQKRVRIVRVFYELVLDKTSSRGENLSYKLYRKETEDLDNFKLKKDDSDATNDKRKTISTYLVADGIKDMFLQYVYMGYKKGDKKEQNKEIEVHTYDRWGDKKETFGVVPCRAEIMISFWDKNFSKTVTMQAIFPIFSFSVNRDEDKKDGGKKVIKAKA